MKFSPRTPGYPYRYIGPKKLRTDSFQLLQKFEVHGDGDGTPAIAVRSAKPEDGNLIADRGDRSPLK